MDNPDLLHIYGQDHEHDDVVILGDPGALRLLRDAIDESLARPGPGYCVVFASDGEGYGVAVLAVNDPWPGPLWNAAAMPYSNKLGCPSVEVLPVYFPKDSAIHWLRSTHRTEEVERPS